MDGMFGDASEDVGQVDLRVDAVHLCCLCRPVNYAERSDLSPAILVISLSLARHSLSFHSAINSGDKDDDCRRVFGQEPAVPVPSE